MDGAVCSSPDARFDKVPTGGTDGLTNARIRAYSARLPWKQNCCVCPWPIEISVRGAHRTPRSAGSSATMAVADRVGSATLVAVTETACGVVIVAGAMYKPELEMLPTAGSTDQTTSLLLVPVMVTVNCRLWPPYRLGAGEAHTQVKGRISASPAGRTY